MKKIKKLMGVMFAIMMVFILATPAFAAGTPNSQGKITINNAEIGKIYKAYRLFDLSLDAKNKNYGYTLNETWKEFFTTGKGKDYVTIDEENGNVKLVDETEAGMQALATVAQGYAESGSLSAEREQEATSEKIIFDKLPLGYYMVTTNAGGLYALDTTDTDVEMYEKNTEPTISKSADKTNAAYGTNVHYTIPFTRGGYVWGDYVITDIMTGLDMTKKQVRDIKITVENTNIATDCSIDYQENFPETGSNTLQVMIPREVLERYKSGTKFVLEYDAVAKKTVSMDNKVTMKYQNGPKEEDGKETPPYEVKVANYEFTVKKTDETGNILNDATFELYTDKDCTPDNSMKFVKDKATNTYRLAEAEETSITAITAGQAKIEGLEEGTYYLKETAAPDGYNKLVKPVEIVIKANLNKTEGSKYYGQAFDENGSRINPTITMNSTEIPGDEFILQVVNKTGTELPSTGGIGTTMFYVAGSVLILAAVVVLMVKKRMNH